MTVNYCSAGSCHSVSTQRCSNCTTTYYCSRSCQKAHWKKHKLTCNGPNAFPPMLPGTFNFSGLPRELRNKIYKELVVGHFSRSEQAEYHKLVSLQNKPDLRNRRRDRMALLQRLHMVGPGMVEVPGYHGFRPLVNARGLLCANKQISKELMDSVWSNNTLYILIDEMEPKEMTSIIPALAVTNNIEIDVHTTRFCSGEEKYHPAVARVQRIMNEIVDALNKSGNSLQSLTVRYASPYPGEIEDLRVDADGLAAHKSARKIIVMDPRTDKMQDIKHFEMKDTFLNSSNIADALMKLTIPVQFFQIVGDVATKDIKRLYDKFGNAMPSKEEKLDKYGQRVNKDAEMFRNMANLHPGSSSYLMDVARSQEQIFSTRALAIRRAIMSSPPHFGPGPDLEYERRLAIARAI